MEKKATKAPPSDTAEEKRERARGLLKVARKAVESASRILDELAEAD
jgi:hypothetical protein